MYLFPSGLGFVSLFYLLLCLLFLKIKKLKSIKQFFLMSIILALVYILVGCIVLFRSPFRETGDVYFSTRLDTKLLTEKLTPIDSANEFVDILIPESEKINESLIELESGQLETKIYKYYNSKDSRVTITVTSLNDKNLLREEYLNEIEYEKRLRYLVDKKDFHMSDNDAIAFCIFPIGFDGTKFMLPFVDSSGANFNAYFYFGDSYVFISELANNIYDLVMPQYLNKFVT